MSNVDHPDYYKAGGIEAIDVIEDWKLDFCLGNAIKYIARAGKKSDDVRTDLEKAAWYIKRHLDGVETGTIQPISAQKDTKYHAEDVCEAWGISEDNLFMTICGIYCGVVVPAQADSYLEYLRIAYYDLIRHIEYHLDERNVK